MEEVLDSVRKPRDAMSRYLAEERNSGMNHRKIAHSRNQGAGSPSAKTKTKVTNCATLADADNYPRVRGSLVHFIA